MSISEGDLKWWQLSLLGIGCTIGTGYFLGSGIGIKITGPSMVLSFILAAMGTYIVYHLLALMTTADPQEGSFCFYAEKAFGRWAGFGCGWNYWSSKILIMGSQLTHWQFCRNSGSSTFRYGSSPRPSPFSSSLSSCLGQRI